MRRVIALLLLAGSPAALFAGDWNQWRGPQRTGVADDSPKLIEALPEKGLKAQWMAKSLFSGNGGWGSPVVAAGRVYVYGNPRQSRKVKLPAEKYPNLSRDQREKLSDEERKEYEKKRKAEQRERRAKTSRYVEQVVCLNLSDGKELWRYEKEVPPTNRPQSTTPAVIGDRVYFTGSGRVFRALDAANGKLLWEAKLPVEAADQQVPSSVAVSGDLAVIFAGQLTGVDLRTRKILWSGGELKGVYSSPSFWKHKGADYVIANLQGRDTVCVSARTGEIKWKVKTSANRSSPTVVGDKLIILSGSARYGVMAFQMTPEKAESLWTVSRLNDQGSCPVIIGGHVFAQGGKRLACVDIATGKISWKTMLDLPNPRYTSLVAADGKVFYGYDGILCFAADASGFKTLFNAKVAANDDKHPMLVSEKSLRVQLNMAELEKTPEGQRKANSLWQKATRQYRPQDCVTPAISEGRLILRSGRSLICFDLRK